MESREMLTGHHELIGIYLFLLFCPHHFAVVEDTSFFKSEQ
jgi:hypothetical protein